MVSEKTLPRTKYDESQLRDILVRLDRKDKQLVAHASGASSDDGAERRWPYARSGITIDIEHPGGGSTRVYAYARCIWSDGISVIAGSFCYPRSTCTVTLVSKDKEKLAAHGTVTVCRHVEGAVHEWELKFNRRIDPQLFCENDKAGSDSPDAGRFDLTSLCGKILFLDDAEIFHHLLAHHLRGSGIELKFCKTPQEAMRLMDETAFDIFLVDFNLGTDGDSIRTVLHARKSGFTGPIVTLTAETSASKLAAIRTAGATHLLAKPYQRQTLLDLMIRLHNEVGAICPSASIFSSLEEQPELAGLLTEYIASTKKTAEQIGEAIKAQSLDQVRELLLNIKGSAIGYGFARLGAAAEDALKALDSTMSIDESKSRLRPVLLLCGKLSLRAAPDARTPFVQS